jgi:pimeloyl-ACP methyl ester carboxylesterase
MLTNENLRAGIEAAKNGDLENASNLLKQVVQVDPNSELGWLWLGFCRAVPEQRAYCFRRVLAINPNNTEARRQLEVLEKPTVAPATTEEPVSTPLRVSPQSLISTPIPPSVTGQRPPATSQIKNLSRKKRKQNDTQMLIWAGSGLALLFCATVVTLVFLGRMVSRENMSFDVKPVATEIITTPTVIVKPTQSYTPIFETSVCNFIVPDQSNVTCGYVAIPEDRYGDVNDTIKIAVAIFHSPSPTPKSDPILYLQGGPGDRAIEWAVNAYSHLIVPLIVERDFIVFDPRGVGLTKPSLDCEEIRQTYISDLQGRFPPGQEVSYYEGALLTCKNRFANEGVDLSTYTSMQMAVDARDVVTALGYQQANLYGISYGTRVAQFVMRNHPEVVRSAILDSVVPVEVQLYNQQENNGEKNLRSLFEDCHNDPACSITYPNLESIYTSTIEQLNAQPVKLNAPINQNRTLELTVDGSDFQNAVIGMLRNEQTLAAIPQLIYRTHNGDNSALTFSAAFRVYAFDTISLVTYISVNCHDQIFAMSMEKFDKTLYELCRIWDVAPLLSGENDPVVSDIPTLIFAGEYDLVTPPSYAHQLAGHLAHSYLAEVPNQGHAPSASETSDCPTKLISSFLQDPSISPNLDCLKENQTIKFVIPYDANPPLTLEAATVDQYQLRTLIPAGWDKGSFGFYNRNVAYGDFTQIGIQDTTISEIDWVFWLKSNFGRDLGFDHLATKHDQRNANGFIWNLYKTSSHGLPVDIAFTKHGERTIMILMVSHPDEHEALYNTVFLPTIDATTPAQ